MIRHFFHLILLLAIILLPLACSNTDNSEIPVDGDTEGDVDGDSTDGDIATDGDEETDGDAEDESVNDSPVRVVKIDDVSEAISGPNAYPLPGDYLLENEKVRFLIQGEGRARSWVPYGGSLIDADIVREGEGHDLLWELTPITAFIRAFEPESFEIINDGSDGEQAQLRVVGHDAGIPIIDSALPLPGKNLRVTLDYELLKDSNYLKITTTIESEDSRFTANLGDGVVWGNRVRILTPGFGWGLEGLAALDGFDLQMAIDADGEAGPDGPVYGLFSAEGPMSVLTDLADILPYMGLSQDIRDGRSVSYTRYFAVGRNSNEVLATYATLRGLETGQLAVTVTADDPQDTEFLFDLEVIDSEGIVEQYARVGVGESAIDVMPGNYTLHIGGEGRPLVEDSTVYEVSAGNVTTATIGVAQTGRVSFTVGGDHYDGTVREGIPSKLTVQPGLDAAMAAPVLRRVYTSSGTGTFLLPPGDYTITATRGYEYEICRQNVTLTEGTTVDFDCYLERSVDTTGWVAGDLHIHTERSIDAIVRVEDRVIQCAAEGLERTPITDHDKITDLDPLVEPLGLRDYIRITAGDEVSPIMAHTNGYPMTDRDDVPLYYGVDWTHGYDENGLITSVKTMPEIWETMRNDFNSGINQINHPRGSQGYFDHIDYNPILGIDALEEGVFDGNWDTVELINSGGVRVGLEKIVPDWFSLINQGIARSGVATSDTHTYSNPGQARTYIRAGTDNPNEISDEDFADAIASMRVQAASGPFVTVQIGDAQIGDTTTAVDGSVTLEIKVQAPSWMPVDWVRIYKNGELLLESTDLLDGVVRFEGSFEYPVDADSWFVVMAGAPESTLAPEGPGQPVLTVANPIFVDAEGDGYQAPGLPSPEAAIAAIESLREAGSLFDTQHHHHPLMPAAQAHKHCGHVAGLGDHPFAVGAPNSESLPTLHDRLLHHHDGVSSHHHADSDDDMHRYGYGTPFVKPFIADGCARPDLIPTTVLR